jgi:hypothetical protein
MRRSKESIENLGQKKEEEKSVIERLMEIKGREEKIAQEDKTGTPWHTINPEDLTSEARKVFTSFESGEFETAKEALKAVREKIGQIKDSKEKTSNEEFANLFDDKIEEKIVQKGLEEDKEKDNY